MCFKNRDAEIYRNYLTIQSKREIKTVADEFCWLLLPLFTKYLH
jgi:hypothetical protein